jgi:hypothetical protein
MSIDILSVTDEISFVVAIITLALAAYRGVEIGRAFANRLYRSRAIWAVVIIMVALVDDLTNIVPSLDTGFLSFIFLALLILAVFVFVDVSIMATIEMDFFHRNTLHWIELRLLGYPLLFGEIAIVLFLNSFSTLPGSPAWISSVAGSSAYTDQTGLAVFGVLAYTAVALVVGARRTPDQTMKRHLQLVGFAFGLFILSTFNDLTISNDLLNDFLAVLGPFVIYFAVMALSSVGRVEKAIAAASKAGDSGVTLPSHSRAVRRLQYGFEPSEV